LDPAGKNATGSTLRGKSALFKKVRLQEADASAGWPAPRDDFIFAPARNGRLLALPRSDPFPALFDPNRG